MVTTDLCWIQSATLEIRVSVNHLRASRIKYLPPFSPRLALLTHQRPLKSKPAAGVSQKHNHQNLRNRNSLPWEVLRYHSLLARQQLLKRRKETHPGMKHGFWDLNPEQHRVSTMSQQRRGTAFSRVSLRGLIPLQRHTERRQGTDVASMGSFAKAA